MSTLSAPDLPYLNRAEGGRALALRLQSYAGRDDVLVLALPRGGVPVGFEVAVALKAPLDILVVRKLGVPGHEELALGAIAGSTPDRAQRVLNDDVVRELGLSDEVVEEVAARERLELERREQLYRGDRAAPQVQGRVVILVDDGLATGATMLAAAHVLRRQEPSRLVVAVPVAASETCAQFKTEVDEVVCAATPRPFVAVGLWYEDFAATSDEEVRELLALAGQQLKTAGKGAEDATKQTVTDTSSGGPAVDGS